METSKLLCLMLFLLQCHVQVLESGSVPCAFNTMCLCWIQDESELIRMDISCLSVPFSRFPDVLVSNVAQLDIVNSGMQVLENDALVSSSGIEALGLMSNRLASIGEKSLVIASGSLRSLDFSFNLLEVVPFKALRGLRKLLWLNLHSNHLTSLDGDWGHVSGTLTNGFFGENCIVEIPRVMSQFESLVSLNLDGNDIQNIPETSLPPNIHTLSINNNLLGSFPQSIGILPSLKWLYLRGNFLKTLDLPLFKSTGVELIDVSDNLIESIRFSTSSNVTRNVRDLIMSKNKVSTLPAGAFQFVRARRIHLSSNNISNIDDEAFRGLEDTLEYLNLENNGLGTVPRAISKLSRITHLYLANNGFHNISSDAFDSFSSNLRVLSLSTNNLDTVPVVLLSGCSRLIHLNLGYNRITDIFPGDFEWSKNLEVLFLRNNIITSLEPGTFKGTKLKELSLSFNHLSEIDDRAFMGIEESLEILEMSFAFSTDVFPKVLLSSLKKLHWLFLDNNNFYSIDADTLHQLPLLMHINLESNRFQYLPEKLFVSEIHRQLRDIKFGYNFIEEIPEGIFQNLTELRSVDLTGNRIRYLVQTTMEDCPKLVTVSLAYNRISVVHKSAFRGLSSLRFLHLEFNALTALDLDAIVESGGTEFSLNVSHNSITVIKYEFGLINLTTLDLGCNNISQLASNTFDGTPNLRTIDLHGNYLTAVHPGTFALAHLETLKLQDNRLESLRKQAFHGTPMLQILDLSSNKISQLSAEQFRNMKNLRILNLSNNRIRSLSRDVFEGTLVESLDLSGNRISMVPSSAFLEVGYTLRDLNLAENFVEHLDATTFPTSQLTSLNLANNRLTILPDNSFVSLAKLLTLNLSQNNFQANSKELFHYLPELRHLYMANCGFRKVPVIPVGNLTSLDLSFNAIESSGNIEFLENLKVLMLVNNSLSVIPDVRLDALRELDLSGNPVEELHEESFFNFPLLKRLILRKLNRIKYVSNNCLRILRYLKDLAIQSWPQADGLELESLLSGLPLRRVEIEVDEQVLKNQIHNAFTRRLRELTITGQELETISPEAFSTIESRELVLRIKDTHVRHLQSDLFLSLARRMSQLTLDLRNNHINELSPSIVYGNLSWETVGTNFISGGLQVSGNPLECDCEIAWLSLWLRRWLRESRQIHKVSQSEARQLRNMASRPVCMETATSHSSDQVLLTLGIPHTACQASALSSGHHSHSTKSWPFFILLVTRIIIDCSSFQ